MLFLHNNSKAVGYHWLEVSRLSTQGEPVMFELKCRVSRRETAIAYSIDIMKNK